MQEHFLKACEAGDLKTVNELINSIDIDRPDKWELTALHFASWYGHADIVAKLIAYGVNIEHQNDDKRTAFHFASMKGCTAIVEKLIAAGANIELQDSNGETALFKASRGGHTAIVEKLIEAGANTEHINKKGKTSIYLALKNKHLPCLALLCPDIINKKDENGNTLLMNACEQKNEEDVLFLHSQDADFNLKNNDGQSAFNILKRKRGLSPALQSLKEQLIMNEMLDEQDDNAMSL